MELVDSYLKAVKRYLPRRQRNDIIAELSEDLRSQLEARQRDLGRLLTEDEQMAIFKRQGDPMAVALRYRQHGRSLTVGWELIGPELFPAYLLLLSMNLVITAVVVLIFQLAAHGPISIQAFFVPLLAQVICVTLVFILLNLLKGVFRRRFSDSWMWPPAELAHLLPLPRWYSATGFVACALLTLWWIALPHYPSLLLGSAATDLKFTPDWHKYFVPILLVLLAGAGQRAVNVVRPDWKWLLPVARFAVDGVGACVMFFFRTHALVQAADGASHLAHAQQLAQHVNGVLVWGWFGPWLWIYLGATALVYGWYCLPYVRRRFRREGSDVRNASEVNSVL
jgi:hypothetical protein